MTPPSEESGTAAQNTSTSDGHTATTADRLRQLAAHLPAKGSVTLTRDDLLELAADGEPPGLARHPGDMTIGELAGHFHRSPSTIRDWCEHHRFEGAYKLNGRDWRIPQAALEAFLAAQRVRRASSEAGAWRAVRNAGMTRSGR